MNKLWDSLIKINDLKNPYTPCYEYPTGERFYVEPVFLLQLDGVKQFVSERFLDVIKEMERLVKKNRLVVFIGEEDNEITNVENAIYLTIQDVCNPINVYMEDKSRGSDYGD
jgi:hypothetical protein